MKKIILSGLLSLAILAPNFSHAGCIKYYEYRAEKVGVWKTSVRNTKNFLMFPGAGPLVAANWGSGKRDFSENLLSTTGVSSVTTTGVPLAPVGFVFGLGKGLTQIPSKAKYNEMRELLQEASLGGGPLVDQFAKDLRKMNPGFTVDNQKLSNTIHKISELDKTGFCYMVKVDSRDSFLYYVSGLLPL